jgi:hypothetical protein
MTILIHASRVDWPLGFVIQLYDLQGSPVIRVIVVQVARVDYPDARRQPGLEVVLLRLVHAVIKVGPSDADYPVLHVLCCPEERHPATP